MPQRASVVSERTTWISSASRYAGARGNTVRNLQDAESDEEEICVVRVTARSQEGAAIAPKWRKNTGANPTGFVNWPVSF